MLFKIAFKDILYFIRKKPLVFLLYIIAFIICGFAVIYISAFLDRAYTDEMTAKTPYIVIFSKSQPSGSVYDILKKYKIDVLNDSNIFIFNEAACEYNMKYIRLIARKEDFRTIDEKYSYTKTPEVPGIIGYRESGRLKSEETLYLSGRGFEKEDRNENNILVSDNLYTFIENEAITLGKDVFNVIGVRVGFTYIDNSFLLDYDRFNQLNITVKAIQINFAFAPLSGLIDKISEEFSALDSDSEILKGDTFGLNTIIAFMKNTFLNLLVILAVLIGCLSLLSCRLQSGKRILGIYSLCGAKKGSIAFLIYFQNFIYIFITYLISAAIFLWLSNTNYKRFPMHPNILLIFICFILMTAVSSGFIFLLQRKENNGKNPIAEVV